MAMGLSLALAGTATAGSHGRSGGSGSHYVSGGSGSHTIYTTHTNKPNGSTHYYKGRDHFHYSSRCWDRRYGCYCYWCPSSYCYYYWCPPDDCYYPVTYCPYGRYCWDK
jgi:hypothetical protein